MRVQILVLFFLMRSFCGAQELWLYPPLNDISPDNQAAWIEARRHFELQDFEACLDICRRLADENVGTALGGEALQAAMYAQALAGDDEGVEATRLRVIAEYPGSRFEVNAKLRIVDEANPSIAGYSDFLAEYGLPPLEGIMSGEDLNVATVRAMALHPETRYALARAYYSAYCISESDQQAANIARFAHQAFDANPNAGLDYDFAYSLQRSLGKLRGKEVPALGEASRPTIEIVSPAPGSTVGTQPTIAIRTTSGDYTKQQVLLSSLTFKVDGVPKQLDALIDSDIDDTLTQGVDFEVLTASLTPTLAPGQHTVEVSIKSGRYPSTADNTATRTWSFTVSENPPPDPDPDPTTDILHATKDALVYEKSPHSNEGANPRLTLEKITGKASRNLLGFDLSGVNLNSLTSATLVLSIDPSDQVSGWGNGETVSVKPVTVAWQEGNGKKFGLPGNQQAAGSGAGTTWFSPTDENIANTSSNGVVQWNGAATYATTGTAPALTVRNNQTGELRFDVTDDVLNGVTHGWLLRKDAENKGSKVSFYSREGGGASLGPRLILEYGGQTAMSGPDKTASAVAGFFGFKSRPLSLQASAGVSEGPKGLGEFLRGSHRAAFVGEQVLLGFAGHHPLTQLGARVVYRSWLRETPSLV